MDARKIGLLCFVCSEQLVSQKPGDTDKGYETL